MTNREENFLELMKTKPEKDFKGWVESVATESSAMTNSFGFHRDELAENIANDAEAKRAFGEIAVSWIGALAEIANGNGHCDGRNEASVRTAGKLANTDAFRAAMSDRALGVSFPEKPERYVGHSGRERVNWSCVEMATDRGWTVDAGFLLAAYWSFEHKTLQQTFSGLCFRFVDLTLPEVRDEMGGSGWWILPLV